RPGYPQPDRAGHAPSGPTPPQSTFPVSPGIDGDRCLGSGFLRPQGGGVCCAVNSCRCVALGQPNVGKTVFTLQFAAYVGVRRLSMAFSETDGRRWHRVLAVDDAVKELVAP